MPKYEIAIEYKSANVSRPVLHQTVGAAVHTRPEIDEVILRCGRATRTAHQAARDYNNRAAALKNRKGRNVRVTLAVGPVER
jgi:hypothetical protein